MPLLLLRMLAPLKIIIVLMSTSAVLLLNLLRRFRLVRLTVKQCCGVIFTDSLLASLYCSYRPLSYQVNIHPSWTVWDYSY